MTVWTGKMLVRDGDERTTLKEMMERTDRAYGLDMSAKREESRMQE